MSIERHNVTSAPPEGAGQRLLPSFGTPQGLRHGHEAPWPASGRPRRRRHRPGSPGRGGPERVRRAGPAGPAAPAAARGRPRDPGPTDQHPHASPQPGTPTTGHEVQGDYGTLDEALRQSSAHELLRAAATPRPNRRERARCAAGSPTPRTVTVAAVRIWERGRWWGPVTIRVARHARVPRPAAPVVPLSNPRERISPVTVYRGAAGVHRARERTASGGGADHPNRMMAPRARGRMVAGSRRRLAQRTVPGRTALRP
jgi:hypothetical protein